MRAAFASIACLALAVPSATAQDFNWENRGDREKLEMGLRLLANTCAGMGFSQIEHADAATMEKRIYSRLLLQSQAEASIEVDRWASWVLQVMDLKNPERLRASSDRAGAAITAAIVDPTSHEAARATYVRAFTDAFRPILHACEEATRDRFVGANYVGGSGSLAAFEAQASAAFDGAVADVAADVGKGAAKPAQ